MVYIAKPATERFWERTNQNGPVHPVLGTRCWDWTAGGSGGRGVFRIDGKDTKAYRFAYTLLVGPIPDGHVLDHLCRRPICVNPQHLEPVLNKENILRGESPSAINGRKEACDKGHPLDVENLVPDSEGYRKCRICHNARSLATYHRNKVLDSN